MSLNVSIATSCLLWARRSGPHPTPCGGHEIFVIDWWNRTRAAVVAKARLPCPFHQFRLVMLHKSCAIESAVLRAVSDRPAYCRTRQDFVTRVLPSHRQGSQVPAFCAWHTRAIRVGRLMTRRALQRRNAFALRPAHDIELMAMAIIALLRMITGSVAVDAAWM